MRTGSMPWTPAQDDAMPTRYDGTGGVAAAADPMADMAPGDRAPSMPDLWQFAGPIRLGLPVASADAGAMPDTPVWTTAPMPLRSRSGREHRATGSPNSPM